MDFKKLIPAWRKAWENKRREQKNFLRWIFDRDENYYSNEKPECFRSWKIDQHCELCFYKGDCQKCQTINLENKKNP
jgi:hypothetical protein